MGVEAPKSRPPTLEQDPGRLRNKLDATQSEWWGRVMPRTHHPSTSCLQDLVSVTPHSKLE